MKLKISALGQATVAKAIMVSGCARSGTTIVGKLIHSLNGVEFVYEPPMLFSLMAVIDRLSESEWKLLYETYLYEDFYIDALCGRRINCNEVDDSSVWKVKSDTEVRQRLTSSIRKLDAESLGAQGRVSFKTPDVTPFLSKLKKYYPSTDVVIVRRDAVGTLSSMLEKKWFSDESLNNSQIWPYTVYQGVQVPYWVADGDYDAWLTMTEVDRCAYYYVRINEGADAIEDKIEVKYRDLIESPRDTVSRLADSLKLVFGCKTDELIDSIGDSGKERDTELLSRIREDYREKVKWYSDYSQ